MFTGLRAGVDVEWAHVTTLEIEDGSLRSATGRVSVVGVSPFSEPAGAFTVTHRTSTPPAYAVKAVKRGDRVELGLLRAGGSEYRIDFGVRVAGPQVLEQLRRIGVPNPEAAYDAVVRRGTITDTATPLVPTSPRVVVSLRPGVFNRETDAFSRQVACRSFDATQEDCFLTRGGERVTVIRLR